MQNSQKKSGNNPLIYCPSIDKNWLCPFNGILFRQKKKRHEVLIQATAWMNFESMMISKKKPDTKDHIFYDSDLFEMSTVGKSVEK